MVLIACGQQVQCESSSTGKLVTGLVGGTPEAALLRATSSELGALLRLDLELDTRIPLELCTGTLIEQSSVLFAAHCVHDSAVKRTSLSNGQGFFLELQSPDLTIHPEYDVALLHLPEPLSEVLPIAFASVLPPLFAGSLVQLAGYGLDSDGMFGTLNFATEHIVSIASDNIVVSGDGLSGACGGDSGGPLLVRGLTGAVEVAGVLSVGSASCRGTDNYVRLDALTGWLTAELSSSSVRRTTACASLAARGACFDGRAIFCERGEPVARDCWRSNDICGWSDAAAGYRCIADADDPCFGIGELGICSGDVAVYCSGGHVEHTLCFLCGATCARSTKTGRARCMSPPLSEPLL